MATMKFEVLLVKHYYSEHAEKYGFGVVERFVGHGVGAVFHSEPIILHHRKYPSKCSIFSSYRFYRLKMIV